MYRVLFAEDEPDVLDAITELLPWERFGFSKPSGCRDGQEAIDLLQSGFAPELVLTDINMPRVDGLSLTEYVTAHLPGTVIVVLSGYDEFSYAQKALKLGVFDYLLKPVTPSDMLAALAKYRAEVERRQALAAAESEGIIVDHFLIKLVNERLTDATVAEQCRLTGISLVGPRFVSCVADVDAPTPSNAGESRSLDLARYGLFNITSELSSDVPGLLCFQGREGRSCMIFQGEHPSEAARAFAEKLRPIAENALGADVSAGIGRETLSASGLYRSHGEALDAMRHRCFHPGGAVLRYDEIDAHMAADFDCEPDERAILASLASSDRDAASKALDALLAKMTAAAPPFDRLLRVAQRLLIRIWQRVSELTGDETSDQWQKESEKLGENSVRNISALGDALRSTLGRAFATLRSARDDVPSNQVMRATAYIRENYARPSLALGDLTELLSVSTSYFSQIFKQKTGRTFIEYLTNVRMEEAKRILAYTDRRAYEVAEDVGFSDPHYFSSAFKKSTGMTPIDFRERARKDGGADAE